jgi:hypothetical protein
LDYDGRVAWFKFRFELVFLHPFARLVALESNDCYVWFLSAMFFRKEIN